MFYTGNGLCHLPPPTTRQCLRDINFKFPGGKYNQFMQCNDQPPNYFDVKDCPQPNEIFNDVLQRCVEDNLCANKANQNIALPDNLKSKHPGEVFIQCIDGKMNFKNCATMYNGGKLLPNKMGCVDKNCINNANEIIITNIKNNMDSVNFHTYPGAIVECKDGIEVHPVQNGQPNVLEKTESVFKHTNNSKWIPFSIKYYMPEFIFLPNGQKKLLQTFRDAPELFTQNKIRVTSFLTNEVSLGAFIRFSLFIDVNKNKDKSLEDDLEIETDPQTVHPCVLFDAELEYLQNAKRYFSQNALACSWINKANLYQFDDNTNQFKLSTNYLPLLETNTGYYTNNLTKTILADRKSKVAVFTKTESMLDSVKFLQYIAQTDVNSLNLSTFFGYVFTDKSKVPKNPDDKLSIDNFDPECKDISNIELLLNVYNYNYNSKRWCLKGKIVDESLVPCHNVMGLRIDDSTRQMQTCNSLELIKPNWYDETAHAITQDIKAPLYIKSYNVIGDHKKSNKATIVSIEDYLKLTTHRSKSKHSTV
jgi:hypothetical protein